MTSSEKQRRAEFEAEALVHVDAVYGLALRLTGGDEARSEDLVQKAFLEAYHSWNHFEVGTNCRAWVMTILRNSFIDEYRKGKKRPAKVDPDEVAERGIPPEVRESDPEGRFFEAIVDTELIAVLQHLDERFRVPLVLSDIEGLGYAEIASELEIPVEAVKSRLFRARRRLQRRLHDYAVEMGYLSP